MEGPAGTSITYVQNLCSNFIAAEGAESSSHCNQLSVDLIPVEHLLIDINPETAKFM